MHSNEVVMMVTRAEELESALENAVDSARRTVREMGEVCAHMECLERLLTEAAQVEGPLSADLRERIADAVGV